MEKLMFSWGDSIVVREALSEMLPSNMATIHFDKLSYPNHLGAPETVRLVKELIKHQTGLDMPFVSLTVGCTGALNGAINVLQNPSTTKVVTGKTYFPFYKGIIANSKLEHITREQLIYNPTYRAESVSIVDSPSNPLGLELKSDADIWDAAYVSKIYGGDRKSVV